MTCTYCVVGRVVPFYENGRLVDWRKPTADDPADATVPCPDCKWHQLELTTGTSCGKVEWRIVGGALTIESVCLRDRHHDGRCKHERVERLRTTETVAVAGAVL